MNGGVGADTDGKPRYDANGFINIMNNNSQTAITAGGNNTNTTRSMRHQKVQEYIEKFANPYVAASKGYIDAVIEPLETRELLLHALKVSTNKDDYRPVKKHGIPPF